jgi:hypothetical protein
MDAGLIDEISDFKSAVATAKSMAGTASKARGRISIMDIKSIEDLKAKYPELVQEIEDKARDGVNNEQTLKSVAGEARTQERDRILGLADVQFGEEGGQKFRAVVDSGVTVEQFKAVSEVTGKAPVEEPESDEANTVNDAKKEMLDAIEGAGAENPGSGNSSGQQANFMKLVDDYQKEHKCSKYEAMQAVNRENPDLRKSYLKSVNG